MSKLVEKFTVSRNLRAYYSADIKEFLSQSINEILGAIQSNNISAKTTRQQNDTWKEEIIILQEQLSNLAEGKIIFEYTIPRMGKRVDNVILYKNIVFLLEFKCGDKEYRKSAYDQVYDYALDLRCFHKESHDKLLVPIVISTCAKSVENSFKEKQRIIEPLYCNKDNISQIICSVAEKYNEEPFDYSKWENSEYFPTPTIVEAAQALYRGHKVRDITRNDAGAKNLTDTTGVINKIIRYSKKYLRKSICFITGVPGAGKTLIGLNIAIQRSNAKKGERAVYLSGNYPLVTVLQEALARDKVEQEKQRGDKNSEEGKAQRSASTFIQIIHKYRDSFLGNSDIPPEHVAIYDEAQRAWTHTAIKNFMSKKKGVQNFPYSEPEYLISTMNRHDDWAVIICLVGGGQEINTGEAGLPEWFDSLRRSFIDWDVYITPELKGGEYCRNRSWDDMVSGLKIHKRRKLYLATSVRSFRTPHIAKFVNEVLDVDTENAKKTIEEIRDKYPIMLTRNLSTAKKWVREQCCGTTRCGMLASSGALRLKAEGISVKNKISVEKWFLNEKDDVRSSYYLEDAATEFDIQGLELDYSIVAWDADFYFDGDKWRCKNFVGNVWKNILSEEKQLYRKNTYRVLLTRARQGMVIFIPEGNEEDLTRQKVYYDGTYEYLKSIGLDEI